MGRRRTDGPAPGKRAAWGRPGDDTGVACPPLGASETRQPEGSRLAAVTPTPALRSQELADSGEAQSGAGSGYRRRGTLHHNPRPLR